MVAPLQATFKGRALRIPLAEGLVVRHATLQGDYLYGKQVKLIMSSAGMILDCDAIHSRWSGQEKFDAWFRTNYNPLILMGGQG